MNPDIFRVDLPVVTDASGDATAYFDFNEMGNQGKILAILYIKTDFADTVDFTITTEETLQNVWVEENVTATKVVYPSALIHDQAGVELTLRDYIPFADERIKVVVANGGDTKAGTFVALFS